MTANAQAMTSLSERAYLFQRNIKQEYSIELLEEYENVNFYSIRMAGEELTELETFFEKFPEGCEYDDEIDVIISWIIVGNLNFTRYEEE